MYVIEQSKVDSGRGYNMLYCVNDFRGFYYYTRRFSVAISRSIFELDSSNDYREFAIIRNRFICWDNIEVIAQNFIFRAICRAMEFAVLVFTFSALYFFSFVPSVPGDQII